MNAASTRNVSLRIFGSRVMNMPQPMVVANHLCASIVTESASSMPARSSRSRSDASAAPPQAAST